VAAEAGNVWVAEDEGGTVARLDPVKGNETWRTHVCQSPIALASGAGVVWVDCSVTNSIVRLDASSGKVIGKPIPTGRDPVDVTLGFDSVWVANLQDGTLTRIQASSGTVLKKAIRVPGGAVRVSVGNGAVWVTGLKNTVARIDPATDAADGAPIVVGDAPLDVDASGTLVWVAVEGAATVVGVDPTSGTPGAPISVGKAPGQVVFVGQTLWVTDSMASTVSAVDVSSGRVSAVPTEATPRSLAWDGSALWVACVDANVVLRVQR
jgi:DNA-binding beta-propeller fold protein YncE